MVETGTADQYFRLEGLKQFKKVDIDRIFEEHYRLVAAYPLNKEIRFVLENVEKNSPNEESLLFVTLEQATDAILPIELMRGGHLVGLDNLLEISSATLYRKSIYIRVRAILVGEYLLKSGDILELVEETEEMPLYKDEVRTSQESLPKEQPSQKNMTLLERALMESEKEKKGD